MQDPETYLATQGLAFSCPVDSGRPALLARPSRVDVGHDIFYCSSAAAARRLRAAPLRYVHTLSDPITHQRFGVTRTSPRTRWNGRAYYFATTATRRAFLAHPDSFAVRRGERMH